VKAIWALSDVQPNDENSLKKHAATMRGAKTIHLVYPQKDANSEMKMQKV
jgi:hypothetical protein